MDTAYASLGPVASVNVVFGVNVFDWTSVHDAGAKEDTKTCNGGFISIEVFIRTHDTMQVSVVSDGKTSMDFPSLFDSHIEIFKTNASMDE